MKALALMALSACVLAAGAGSTRLTAAAKPATIVVVVSGLGCSTAIGADSFEARSWLWGASNVTDPSGGGGGAGKAVVSALTLTRLTDACSPALLGGVILGKHFPTLSLTQYDVAGMMTATVVLNDVMLSDWKIGGSSTSPEATEQIQVLFGRFSFTDVASGNKFCYDPVLGRAC